VVSVTDSYGRILCMNIKFPSNMTRRSLIGWGTDSNPDEDI
jgi:hypothetical protein